MIRRNVVVQSGRDAKLFHSRSDRPNEGDGRDAHETSFGGDTSRPLATRVRVFQQQSWPPDEILDRAAATCRAGARAVMQVISHESEIQSLRRGVEDLAALSTLSALWSRAEPLRIAEALADVLFRVLALQFIFVRLHDAAAGHAHDAARPHIQPSATHPQALGKAVEPLLQLHGCEAPQAIVNPLGDGTVQIAIFPIGCDADCGVLVAGSQRPDFPSEIERVALDIAANQAAAVLQQRRSEQSLRDSEERFRLLVESVTDYAIFMLDPRGYVVSWNAGAQRIKGYTPEEIIGQHFSRFYPEQAIQDGWPEKELEHAEAQGCVEDEGWRLRKDGSRFWANVVITAVHDPSGALRGYAKITRDLTGHKRAEEQLRHGQERLRQLAAASVMIASTTTTESALRIATEQARAIIGTHQSVSSLTDNQRWPQAVHAVSLSDKYARWRSSDPKPDTRIQSLVCGANRTMRLTHEELQAHPALRSSGEEAGEHPPLRGLLAVPLVGHNGNNLGLIQVSDTLDGSDFTAADEATLVQLATVAAVAVEHARLCENLGEAQRRKDEFLATLAHELRNPLGTMSNAVTLLERRREPDRVAQSAFDILDRQLRQMTRLTEDLLDVSRIAEGKLEMRMARTALAAVIKDAIEVSHPHIDGGSHKLTVTLPPEPIWLIHRTFAGRARRARRCRYNLKPLRSAASIRPTEWFVAPLPH